MRPDQALAEIDTEHFCLANLYKKYFLQAFGAAFSSAESKRMEDFCYE